MQKLMLKHMESSSEYTVIKVNENEFWELEEEEDVEDYIDALLKQHIE